MSTGTGVTDMAIALRDCLLTELALRDNPPAETCFIPGEDGREFLSIGLAEDKCCNGFAWVRVAGVNPIFETYQTDGESGNCGVLRWRVDYEIGVARCAPWGDAQAGPSCAEWTATAVQVQSDAEAMRAALCCLRPQVASGRVQPAPWLAFGPAGGCTGGIMGVSIQIDDCGCDN